MTDLIYNITREKASEILNMSTRTIDRYVKKWKLTYKKISNRVFLSMKDINKLQEELWNIDNIYHTEVIWNHKTEDISAISNIEKEVKNFSSILEKKDQQLEEKNKLIFAMQHKLWEYESKLKHLQSLPNNSNILNKEILEKKDKQLEEKNSKISILQNKIWVIETKFTNMITKSEHESKLSNIKLETERLELENSQIREELKKENIKNLAYILLVVFMVIVLIMFFVK